jgi:hypothetical protein
VNERKAMNKEEAHKLLDRAKFDALTPVKEILDALEATGDLSRTLRTTDRTLFGYGNESVYCRTRQMDGTQAS